MARVQQSAPLPALQHRVMVEVGKPELLWPHWPVLTGFLCFLYCLHVYWCAAAARRREPCAFLGREQAAHLRLAPPLASYAAASPASLHPQELPHPPDCVPRPDRGGSGGCAGGRGRALTRQSRQQRSRSCRCAGGGRVQHRAGAWGPAARAAQHGRLPFQDLTTGGCPS